jgi:ketosteroid isomerase-like protein
MIALLLHLFRLLPVLCGSHRHLALENLALSRRRLRAQTLAREGSRRTIESSKSRPSWRRSSRRQSPSGSWPTASWDDVEWEIPGAFHVRGKDAFDTPIEDEGFVGSPAIAVTRLMEDDDVVVAEGSVRTQRKDGAVLHLAFCDVFEMQARRIRRLTSYLLQQREHRARGDV